MFDEIYAEEGGAYRRHPLDAFFAPRNVAVIGASEAEESIGRTLFWNLISHPFGGAVYPINPKRDNVLGVHAYATIDRTPEPVELAVIATPAASTPDVVQACAEAGVRGAIIVSAGFKESGEEGRRLEEEILARARPSGMRIIGPNSLGVMSPLVGVNASAAQDMARPGGVGFISQSGALATAVLDWSFQENVGFSAFLSLGSMLDVSWADLIYYLGESRRTKAIVLYLETIGNARAFLSAAREVALEKPIIVLKAGRTEPARQAATTHTGAMAGSDEALDAAFRRSGILRVNRIAEMFSMAEALAKQPRPQGPKLTILTNAGGPGIVATDALIESGGKLTPLAEETLAALDQTLPPTWSDANPIDIDADAGPDRYAESAAIAHRDRNADGLLIVLTPQAKTHPTQTAKQVVELAGRGGNKPLLTSWMGGPRVAEGRGILNQAGVPTFPYPDIAARIFSYMWRYTYNLRGIYETPSLPPGGPAEDRQRVAEMIETARANGRILLTELESKQIFAAYGVPTVETRLARDMEEAVALAEVMGYPVAVKLNSKTVAHKGDVGGVQLNLHTGDQVRTAYEVIEANVRTAAGEGHFQGVTVQPMVERVGYELIIGSSQDPRLGPVLLFGAGGALAETLGDQALALPPLNTTLARRMMEQTRIYGALSGRQGRRPVDLEALEGVLVRFSHLALDQPWIKEIEINPLLVCRDQIIALDARVLLHAPDTDESQLTPPAIRPYPVQYVQPFTTRSGEELLIRPIRPEDEPMMGAFNRKLSPHSIYLRYFHPVSPQHLTSHRQLATMCFIDYDRTMTLVAERTLPNGRADIVGMGQLTRLITSNDAEFAILIIDEYQRTGLGTELLKRLLDIGREEGVEHVMAEILPENEGMRRVCEKLGFTFTRVPGSRIIYAEVALTG